MAIKKSFSKDKKKCKVTFSLPAEAAPSAKVVKVVGDFNNWNWNTGIKLKKSSKEFKATYELEPGQRYEFRYLIDNEIWGNDWKADEYTANPFGVDNSVVIIPSTINAQQAPAGQKAPEVNNNLSKSTIEKSLSKKSTSTKRSINKSVGKKTTKSNLDFTVIEGVGPKIAQLLVKAGYNTFEDLSKSKVADLRKVLKNAGARYQMHNPTNWAKQSKFAANDQWTKLNEFQASLKVKK